MQQEAILDGEPGAVEIVTEVRRKEALLKAGALQDALFNSANFSSIATDEKGIIQLFNVGAERTLGYPAAEVLNKITPAEISDPQEVIARAKALSLELETTIAPGFEALVFKASRQRSRRSTIAALRARWEGEVTSRKPDAKNLKLSNWRFRMFSRRRPQ
jgi:PAS domain-containing protein